MRSGGKSAALDQSKIKKVLDDRCKCQMNAMPQEHHEPEGISLDSM